MLRRWATLCDHERWSVPGVTSREAGLQMKKDVFYYIDVHRKIYESWRLKPFDERRSSEYFAGLFEWAPAEIETVKFLLDIGPMRASSARITFYSADGETVTAVYCFARHPAGSDLADDEVGVLVGGLVEALLQRVASLRGWPGTPPPFPLTAEEERWRIGHGASSIKLSRVRHSVDIFEGSHDQE